MTIRIKYIVVLFLIIFPCMTITSDAKERKEIYVYPNYSYYEVIRSVCFSPNGKYIASGGQHGIKLWHVKNMSLIRTFNNQPGLSSSLCFSPDGKRIASGGDTFIKVWRVNDGILIKSFEDLKTLVLTLTFSPDGEFIAYGGYGNNYVGLLNVKNMYSGYFEFVKHANLINSVNFRSDGKCFASGSSNKSIKVWCSENKPVIRQIFEQPSEQRLKLLGGEPSITPENKIKVTTLWHAEAKSTGSVCNKVFYYKGLKLSGFNSVAFSPEGSILASGCF